jgi:hypothetical protein
MTCVISAGTLDPRGWQAIKAGKLYGTLANGGSHGAGLVYDLAERAGHWFVSSLYSFLGGSDGSSPNGAIVGPGGALYGAANGEIQSCGSNGSSNCGLIYEARPGPAACATALCSWNETAIYQFTGNSDAWGGNVSTFDSAGNLYGISWSGGSRGDGAVFELTPSGGGWTEKILYSFLGGNDGAGPSSLLLGHDGKIYGTAAYGGIHGLGVVFQLAPSGAGWKENVLYAFTGANSDGFYPGGLVQDSSGGLYGFSTCQSTEAPYCWGAFDDSYGLVFGLSLSGNGWQLSPIYWNAGDCDWNANFFHALTIDAAGNLYAAEGGSEEYCNPDGCYVGNCGNILKVSPHQPLVSGTADIFYNLTSDANGNLYGTTSTCGFGTPSRSDGMIWQYSP